jgi:hypothetical protein
MLHREHEGNDVIHVGPGLTDDVPVPLSVNRDALASGAL